MRSRFFLSFFSRRSCLVSILFTGPDFILLGYYLLFPQLDDAVAQQRRFLKLQVPGGGFHLRLKFFHQAGYIFLGSMGIMLGGSLSDRMPRMPLLVGSLVLPVPLLIVALRVDTGPFIVLLLAANFLMQSAAPIYVVLAQEVMPGRESVGSSMAMGLAWGVGGLLALPIGAIAGHLGLLPVLTALAALPLAALPLLLLVDGRRVGAPQAAAESQPATLGNRE